MLIILQNSGSTSVSYLLIFSICEAAAFTSREQNCWSSTRSTCSSSARPPTLPFPDQVCAPPAASQSALVYALHSFQLISEFCPKRLQESGTRQKKPSRLSKQAFSRWVSAASTQEEEKSVRLREVDRAEEEVKPEDYRVVDRSPSPLGVTGRRFLIRFLSFLSKRREKYGVWHLKKLLVWVRKLINTFSLSIKLLFCGIRQIQNWK